jgi:ribosomal protein L11 methyltransferase
MYVCDVGTGSGILGIAAQKIGAKVDICDTDPVSIEDSLKNFTTNGLKPNNYWTGSINNAMVAYDVIIANIVADVLMMISKDIKKHTANNAIVILSGIMEQHKDKVIKKFLKNNDCEIIEELQKNEWVTLVLKIKKDNDESK